VELTFGAWLKKRRLLLDLTQEELAKRALCSTNSIRKIESDDLTPSKTLAEQLARALDIAPAQHADFIRFARTRDATVPENAFSGGMDRAPFPSAASGTLQLPGEKAQQLTVTVQRPFPTTTSSRPVQKFQPPAALTAVIGRELDTSIVTKVLRLPTARLVTLTGPPGTGKTRLSIQVAAELQDEFEHGAAFVELAPLSHAALVETALAQALNVRSTAQTPLAALRAFLYDKQLLLVLDNFEHVLDAASLVTDLLTHAPRLKVLTTSRERLRVYGERELPIAPLAVPPLDPLPMWNELETYAAVRLFVERAQAVQPSFQVTAENAEAVARLCVGLEGLPLAIEMAAARVKWETPQQLVPQLTRRLEILRSRQRERDARQQTLRSAIDWSYELLEQDEQRLLRRLGVFRGGFTSDAAQAVCEFPARAELENLVEKSLVKMEHDTRFTLLEMIREYALDKLNAHGEAKVAHTKHAQFFTGLAETHEPALRSAEGFELVHLLDPDQDNLREALEWSIMHQRANLALRLAAALAAYWDRKSAAVEGIAWLERVLEMEIELDDDLMFARAKVRDAYAEFIRLNGDYARAREMLDRALDDWRRSGARGKPFLAAALIPSSRVALDQGDDALAYALAMESLQVNTELGDKAGLCQSWRRLADWALNQRDLKYAEECLARSLDYAKESKSDHELCTTLRFRGDLYRIRGEYDRANADYAYALALNETIKDDYAEIRMKRSLGVVAILQGEIEHGVSLVQEAAHLAHTVGNHAAMALVFGNLALAASLQEDTERAVRLLGAMDTLMQQVKMRLIAPDLFEYQETLERVKQQVSERDLECWREEGRALAYTDAFALAMQTL
jgi:predicted ATPase/transcriptional regulator with XRE-family HTH domain